MEPVRIFIGTSANGEDKVAEMAYEYSIRSNTDREVEIVWMRQTRDTSSFWHGFNTSKWATPFSGFRWAIPEYCNYKGRAIYTDADMLNFCDMGELFDLPMNDKWILARKGKRFAREYCVMLMDCSKFSQINLGDKSQEHYHGKHYRFFTGRGGLPLTGDLDPAWNSLDGDIEPFKQLHFTNMRTQPWCPSWFNGEHKEHKLAGLFWDIVEDARANGWSEDDYDPTLQEGFQEIPFKTKQTRY